MLIERKGHPENVERLSKFQDGSVTLNIEHPATNVPTVQAWIRDVEWTALRSCKPTLLWNVYGIIRYWLHINCACFELGFRGPRKGLGRA